MKNVVFSFLVVCFCIAVTSCEKESFKPEQEPDPEEIAEKEYPFSLIVSNKNIPLFKETKLSIYSEEVPGGIGLLSFYDSIKWTIPEKFVRISAPNTSFLLSVNHRFHLPGNHPAILEGYKNGEIIYRDEQTIQVYADGDFLGIYWTTPASEEKYPFSCMTGNSFINLEYISADIPYVHLTRHSEKFINEEKWIEFQAESKIWLYEYITELYGKPLFYYEGEDIVLTNLQNEYAQRFKNSLSEVIPYSTYVPVAIWETKTTNIALIGSIKSGIETDIHYFKIYAEPK